MEKSKESYVIGRRVFDMENDSDWEDYFDSLSSEQKSKIIRNHVKVCNTEPWIT